MSARCAGRILHWLWCLLTFVLQKRRNRKMSDELNNCGCGGQFDVYVYIGESGYQYYAICKQCRMSTPDFRSVEELHEMINTAHPLSIRLDDIREMVEHCKTEYSIHACNRGACKYSQMCRAVSFGFNVDGIMNIDVDTIERYCRERGEG